MTERKKLFGTDGVRGVAGEVVTAELATALGRAAVEASEVERPQVLIVRDTRESGPMLEAALAAGIAEGGGDALIAGVLPTPAASVLVRRLGLDAGAVVSASHNPWRDNGIKLFGGDGAKLEPEVSGRIETLTLERLAAGRGYSEASGPLPESGSSERLRAHGEGGIGRVRTLEAALDDYLRELASNFPLDLSGHRIALDCANGATYRAAPLILERLGAEVEPIGTDPDGRNINEGVGSTRPDALVKHVAETGAEIGFAFDGDGDRVIAVDRSGAVRDGDDLIAIAATHLREASHLGGVAVTVMTNYGFHKAMGAAGIEVETTDVGDENVAAAMRERDWPLGGEQSGHVIWTGHAPTGDGVAAALLTLTALGDRPLADVRPFERLPQLLRNVEVRDREAIEGASELWEAVERENAALEGRGRVLVRPSGTEPLVRVMVEAPDEAECDAVCTRLVEIVEKELA
jgi:phosphoglucosamine mutase